MEYHAGLVGRVHQSQIASFEFQWDGEFLSIAVDSNKTDVCKKTVLQINETTLAYFHLEKDGFNRR